MASADAIDADGGDLLLRLPASCAGAATPPASLVCTGLYADVASKTLAPGVEAYAPAVPLWSDGASKQRWIGLPAGTKIDNTNPDEWIFPVGTKLWKEFSKDGKRVETRLWQKVSATFWVERDVRVERRRVGGHALGRRRHPVGHGHVPHPHERRVPEVPPRSHRSHPRVRSGAAGHGGSAGHDARPARRRGAAHVAPEDDDARDRRRRNALAAPALAWLHVNCGTTCHNRNSNATAWSTGMFLRLDPTALDGRSSKGFDALTTTIGVAETSPNWPGRTRIVAHDPAHSLLYQLISHRGTGNQMPPIATSVVDEADIPLVAAWIEQLPAAPSAPDAGAEEAGQPDAGAEEAGQPDARATDGGVEAPAADSSGFDTMD